MAYTPAIRRTNSALLRSLRQYEGTTGNRLTPDQIRAITEGGLSAEASMGIERARLEEQQRQFDETMALKKKAMSAEERSSAITGAAGLGSLAYETFVLKPKALAIEADKARAIRELRTGVTAPGVATSSALTEGNAIADAYEVGGSTPTAGASVVGPALGTFGISDVVSANVGKGKGRIASGAASGAVTGTYLFPGIGTVAGGIIGGVSGYLNSEEGTVLCHELYRQGYLPRKVLKYDEIYADLAVDIETYIGYRFLADPVVRKMRKSKMLTLILKPFILSFAYTMANRLNKDIKVNRVRKFLGTMILKLGTPICRRSFEKFAKGGICYG